MLVTVTLPLALPVAAGVKVTLNVAVCAAFKLVPAGMPLAAKPGPERLTFEIVTWELVEFVRVTLSVLLLPWLTFPKFTVEELDVSCPAVFELFVVVLFAVVRLAFGIALVVPEQPD